MTNNTKICSKCGIEKDLDEFNKDISRKDNKQNRCRDCQRKIHSTWCLENKEYRKQYYKDNKEHLDECHKQYVIDNPEIVKKCNHNKRAKRRGWGKVILINKSFPGSHCHHLHVLNTETGEIDHCTAINIPAELHKSIWHSHSNKETMDKINQAAFEWLATQSIIEW